jgi:hypothetical protein
MRALSEDQVASSAARGEHHRSPLWAPSILHQVCNTTKKKATQIV